MKKMKLFILLPLFLSITRMYAQEGAEPCANFNSFLQSNQNISILDSLFGGRTTKTGMIEFDIEKSIGFGLLEDHQDLFDIDGGKRRRKHKKSSRRTKKNKRSKKSRKSRKHRR